MKELSRVDLYTATIEYLNNLRNHDENHTTSIIRDQEELIKLLQFNIEILQDIERRFIGDEAGEDSKQDGNSPPKTLSVARTKEEENQINNQFNMTIKSLILNKEDSIKKYEDEKSFAVFYQKIDESSKAESTFNTLLNELNDISQKELKKIKINKEGLSRNIEHKKVFLSYAFIDRLYTLCLYFYMQKQGIDLYVDWLYCDELKDGALIKQNLCQELENSDQLLFFRSASSELHIKGNVEVKGWCGWEMGVFYQSDAKKKNEKFYIELYDKRKEKSKQLDGISKLRGVSAGRLFS